MHIHIYIYIYIERERDIERESSNNNECQPTKRVEPRLGLRGSLLFVCVIVVWLLLCVCCFMRYVLCFTLDLYCLSCYCLSICLFDCLIYMFVSHCSKVHK